MWGPITPKWLGSYELELHVIIETIIVSHYTVIIDVGCAEGYYAVGLAHRIPTVQVFAYDTDFISRRQTQRLAHLNGVGRRVNVLSYCSNAEISKRSGENTLLICDIEGFERALLNPKECLTLLQIDILVEVHEGNFSPSTYDLLMARFSCSHRIKVVHATDRQIWVQSAIKDPQLGEDRTLLLEAANEHRANGQTWLWMTAQSHASAR